MLLNGIDLDGLGGDNTQLVLPEKVQGRVAHIDADFLAYQTTAVKGEVTFDEMKNNVKAAIEGLVALSGATSFHLHITPSGSDKGGRGSMGIQKPYQGNRDGKEKPQYLNLMRQHLATAYPGTLHQFCEADDGMSSAQYDAIRSGSRTKSIIVSKDKDLDMVPGLHLNWDTGQITDAEEFGSIWLVEKETASGKSVKLKGYGQKFFWAQMLMGDTADHVQGLPLVHSSIMEGLKFKEHGKKVTLLHSKCGVTLTNKLLNPIQSNRQAFAAVQALYRACPKEFVHWETGEPATWQQVFVSEAMMLWMRRDKTDKHDVLKWFKEISA